MISCATSSSRTPRPAASRESRYAARQRFATVEEVANMVLYIASPQESAANGAARRVDGGAGRAFVDPCESVPHSQSRLD
jgi:NAD(P)-dependent dehydrogenase (short-subunit alcohol dehydrogenase family)